LNASVTRLEADRINDESAEFSFRSARLFVRRRLG
jgi:hypothetical protein